MTPGGRWTGPATESGELAGLQDQLTRAAWWRWACAADSPMEPVQACARSLSAYAHVLYGDAARELDDELTELAHSIVSVLEAAPR
jgi:hypothetical protein